VREVSLEQARSLLRMIMGGRKRAVIMRGVAPTDLPGFEDVALDVRLHPHLVVERAIHAHFERGEQVIICVPRDQAVPFDASVRNKLYEVSVGGVTSALGAVTRPSPRRSLVAEHPVLDHFDDSVAKGDMDFLHAGRLL